MNKLEPLPEHARRALARHGIWPADVRVVAMADLSLEGAFAEAWVVLTSDSLAVVEGPAVASGGKHGLTPWRETRFRSHRLDEIEQLNAESMPLGGLLSASTVPAWFSVGTRTRGSQVGIYIKLFPRSKTAKS